MDISLSVSLEEAEIIIMNGISQGAVMPYADIMLDSRNIIKDRKSLKFSAL